MALGRLESFELMGWVSRLSGADIASADSGCLPDVVSEEMSRVRGGRRRGHYFTPPVGSIVGAWSRKGVAFKGGGRGSQLAGWCKWEGRVWGRRTMIAGQKASTVALPLRAVTLVAWANRFSLPVVYWKRKDEVRRCELG